MKVRLLYRNTGFDRSQTLPEMEKSLEEDLELALLFGRMGGGDKFLEETVRRVMLAAPAEQADIRYRQEILKDCLNHRHLLRQLYHIACEAEENDLEKYMGFFQDTPENILESARKALEAFVPFLKQLSELAENAGDDWESSGFNTFFAMIRQELDGDYIRQITGHLRELAFQKGILLKAGLGKGLRPDRYVLYRWRTKKETVKERFFGRKPSPYAIYISDYDKERAGMLADIKNRGLMETAGATAQVCARIRLFFADLKSELSFYVGCVNLYESLTEIGVPVSFPAAWKKGEGICSFENLCNITLALQLKKVIPGNTVDASNKSLIMITGANQGGKTTFLRSVGQACLMAQCGMFVSADRFDMAPGMVYTHFIREEDGTMKSGKLDEELKRMSRIVDFLTPGSVLFMNESFSSTNEQEGSEIAGHILQALTEQGIRIFFVSHFYKLAKKFYDENTGAYLFLRANRNEDGSRSYILTEGEPLTTGYGEDIYKKVFG